MGVGAGGWGHPLGDRQKENGMKNCRRADWEGGKDKTLNLKKNALKKKQTNKSRNVSKLQGLLLVL